MELPVRHDGDGADRELADLQRAFAQQLERWPDFGSSYDERPRTAPLADVEETDDSYLLDVELPGVDRQHVHLQVQPDRVVLTAERHERRRLGLLRHRTRTTGLLALALGLPAPVDPDGVTAELERGVLSVVLPKADAARRRRVPVRHRGS